MRRCCRSGVATGIMDRPPTRRGKLSEYDIYERILGSSEFVAALGSAGMNS